ncbi:MAG: ABC transporter permease [Oscillospiraceae bacterium]|nr:ABC transporter permease [Oscillospiraceae bacterium]
MKGMLTIFKKELARFFGDRRLAFVTIFLPGILIYTIYSLMGTFVMSDMQADSSLTPVVAVSEVPISLKGTLEQICEILPLEKGQDPQELIDSQEVNAVLLFPENFDVLVEAYEVGKGVAPSVELYCNSSDANSYATNELLCSVLNTYETALVNKFDITQIDTVSAEAASGQFFASILPMLLMTLLYSSCTSVATEAIAGEKERGTIATLLITPVSRSHIALGKILALSLIALLAGASNALGTILSLPKLMGGELTGSIYGLREYALLAAVILSTVLLMVTAISLISTFAKSVKEASTMTAPLMVLVMFLGVIGMAGLGSADNYALYLIPLYNSSQAMTTILSFGDAGLPVLLTVFSNILFTLGGVWLLTKLFHSEKILFKI